jgi:hypothetical protein
LMEIGFDRIIYALPPADAETVLPLIQNYARLKEQFSR